MKVPHAFRHIRVLLFMLVWASAAANPYALISGEAGWDAVFTRIENNPAAALEEVAAAEADRAWLEADARRPVLLQLVRAGAHLFLGRTAETLELAAAAVERARELEDPLLTARGLHVLSMGTFFTRDYARADALAGEVLELAGRVEAAGADTATQASISRLRAGAKGILGNIATMQADLPAATAHYLDALRIADELGDELRGMKLRANLGNVRMMAEDSAGARRYYEEALAYAERTGNIQVMLVTRTNLAGLYEESGEFDKQFEAYGQSLEMARAHGLTQVIPTILINLADYHARKEDWEQARRYAEEAIELSRSMGDDSTYAVAHVNLGIAVRGQGGLDQAMAYFRKAEGIFIEQDALYQLEELYGLMAETWEEAGDYRQALEATRRLREVSERHRNAETAARLEALRAQYDNERQERRIAELQRANLEKQFDLEKKELANRNQELELNMREVQLRREVLLRNGLTVGLVVVFALLYLLLRLYRTERRDKAELARLNQELTEREEALREGNEELRRVLQEKDDVLAVVSHDLKNPITGIQGMAELLEEEMAEAVLHKREMVQAIRETADRMFAVVSDLLDAYRIKLAGGGGLAEAVDAVPVCRHVAEVWEEPARQKRQQLVVELPDHPVPFSGDRTRLFQIVDNLVSNAIKYSPHGKVITLALTVQGRFLRIAVIDQGPGISAEERKQLFRKFSRTSARPTGGEDSTGLGLSIVRRLVKSMHGEVWCESEPGKGASFIVTFPREDTGKAFINAAADSGELRGLRVLVVDDNAVHRHLVCEKLAAMGAAVESVGDGAAALELTDKGGIDAVVLDLHMPGIDGFDYIERLRAKPADGAAPLILATSATAMEADLQRLRRLGIDRFIAKPLSRQALRDHLQALVR